MRIQRKIKRYFDTIPIDLEKDKMLAFYSTCHLSNKPTSKLYYKIAVRVCLCLALVLCCFLAFSVYSEAREYKEAVTFFERYDLSTSGLSRSEVKKVYKDISTGTFTYDKTIEIMNTISMEIYQVELEDANPDVLKALWHQKYSEINAPENKEGIKYLFNGTFFQKYNNGELIWQTDVGADIDCCYLVLDKGILIAGNTENGIMQAVLLDDSGNIQWEYQSKAVMRSPSIAFKENTIHIVGQEYQSKGTKLSILNLDLRGSLISETTNMLDEYINIQSLAVTDDGYIVKAFQGGEKEILGLSFNGELLNKTIFTLNGRESVIKDILYYEGQLYISAVFFKTNTDAFYSDKFSLLYEEFWTAYEANGFGAGNENYDFELGAEYNTKLADIFKEQYSASLLILDEDGSVNSVYTVNGGYCTDLSVSETEQLLWQVFRIDQAKLAIPPVSSCSAYIYSTEFAFCFDNEMLLNKFEVGSEVVWDVTLFQ